MEIRDIQLKDLFNDPAYPALRDEYWGESGNPELGRARISEDYYRAAEASGTLFIVGAYEDGGLGGWAMSFMTGHPHYGKWVVVVDAIFLTKGSRRGAAGLQLMRAAFSRGESLGAEGAYLSAPHGSRLEALLSKTCRHADSVFWKKF